MEVISVKVLCCIGMLMVKFIAIQAHIIWTKLHTGERRNNSYINMLLGYRKVHAHLTEQPWTQTLNRKSLPSYLLCFASAITYFHLNLKVIQSTFFSTLYASGDQRLCFLFVFSSQNPQGINTKWNKWSIKSWEVQL